MSKEEQEFLKGYNSNEFEKPSVTVDMLIFTVRDKEVDNYRKLPEKKLSLLLIKRKGHPYKDKWALPGGFVDMDESLEEAAIRELKEETNLDNIYMEQLYTWGDVDRDPRTRVISASYMALVDSATLDIKAGDDAYEAKWFDVECKLYETTNKIEGATEKLIKKYNLVLTHKDITLSSKIEVTSIIKKGQNATITSIIENNDIAFDHAKIIRYGIDRLRNKIEYTDIAFNLMSDYFTLSELQQVYEIILDKELLRANFRRKIKPLVKETNKYQKENKGHRPSKLYKYNKDYYKGENNYE
ncbi:TPA: NUDIX hydrolase [bacterium]|nr:NUDIX hydrolase [bacterium]